jgi:hypothetical protein
MSIRKDTYGYKELIIIKRALEDSRTIKEAKIFYHSNIDSTLSDGELLDELLSILGITNNED